MAASSSTENKNLVPIKEKTMQYYLYPPPIAQYEDVIANAKLFMDILGKFHAAMGTKFKIPIVGGKDLDLHRLFMEVTSRGGIKRVLEEKKWREVTNCFSFPPSATNASFILRKYYMSLIHHFEQVYYFKAKAWTPSTKSTLTSTSGMNKAVLPLPEIQMAPLKQQTSLSPEIQVTSVKRQRTTDEDASSKDSPESSIGLPVTGIIDGKFESGYLCTVRIGGEQLQGVLYQTVQTPSCETPKHDGQVPQLGTMDATQASTVVRCRRRRRKKSEMRKRDPAHPKPNRSGYNFFFAEQHARLKLLHTGKDRGISRMIAVKDKERYITEMQHYRESFRRGGVISNAMPSQQQYFMLDTNMMLVENTEYDGGSFHRAPENELTSGYCDNDKSSFEGEEKTTGKDSNLGTPLAVEMGAENVEIETVAGEKDLGLAKIDRVGKEFLEDAEMKQEELLFGGHKKPFNIKGDQSFLDESLQQKSVSVQENEPLIIENESKQDGKSPDEPKMSNIDDEIKTKSADNQERDSVAIQEKFSVKFDGIIENGSYVTNEEIRMENPMAVQEREVVTGEDIVGNKPEPFHQKELVYISENLEKDPQVSQETVSTVREVEFMS
ncbi:ARID/BRIGHT DNA-binding domain-containing protein [Cynara cardunculus var. scolymus]|uniref:ARID/BRIGHT DNA-binding domain-containing protein n=1 Tax=Cynara cardunculus var. scolymus TaxID=59895 RepID=A0A124SH33_CYNCS|nr:ARID/BRIGHT DNA-binding domain-containing protein [Cynara cardunculus var. scolymus]